MTLVRGIFLLVFWLVLAASFVSAAPDALPSVPADGDRVPAIREFYGTINKVNAAMAVINQIPFDFDADRDIGPGRFVPGDYVIFRLGDDNRIVMIERTKRAVDQAQVTAELLQAVGFDASPSTRLER